MGRLCYLVVLALNQSKHSFDWQGRIRSWGRKDNSEAAFAEDIPYHLSLMAGTVVEQKDVRRPPIRPKDIVKFLQTDKERCHGDLVVCAVKILKEPLAVATDRQKNRESADAPPYLTNRSLLALVPGKTSVACFCDTRFIKIDDHLLLI